jgi:hypothetical protein
MLLFAIHGPLILTFVFKQNDIPRTADQATMKIRISKNIKVPLSTIFRIQWRKFYPQLIIHERFEKYIKWTLRLIAFIGIASSVISIEKWYISLAVALAIFGVEQYLERIIFEYTSIVVQPFPDFKIDLNQWASNGFEIPIVTDQNLHCYFGPAYLDEGYARKFFSYIRSWNDDQQDDPDNIVCVSFIMEPDGTYTTCIYANPDRKRLDEMFDSDKTSNQLVKFGKIQQRFFVQMNYWKNLDYSPNYFIHKFLTFPHVGGQQFIFTPFVIVNKETRQVKALYDIAFRKFHFKHKKREELQKHEPEYRMK